MIGKTNATINDVGSNDLNKLIIERTATDLDIPNDVTSIGNYAFYKFSSLTDVTIPDSVISIGDMAFEFCTSLSNITIPNSVISISSYAFRYCDSLTNVTIEQGFNANKLNLSASTLYSAETIVSWLEALADRTGWASYNLTIGTTNLAKLTEEQIAIATAKNWTLA